MEDLIDIHRSFCLMEIPYVINAFFYLIDFHSLEVKPISLF